MTARQELAITAGAVALLLLAIEHGAHVAGVQPPPEIRSTSWTLTYWAATLDCC